VRAPLHGSGGSHRRPPATAAPRAARAADAEDPDADAETDSLPYASAAATEIVRWGVFSCVLVPVVLLICGSSTGGAIGTAAGLAAVTAACRALLRQSERAYAQRGRDRAGSAPDRPGPHRGRHSRTGTGLHRGGRHPGQQ